MSEDEASAPDGSDEPDDEPAETPDAGGRFESTRERLGEEADRAVTSFDEGIVDILSWVLDTETRARIYVYLRQHPWSTSEEVAEGTGLYPSTVREALAELADEEKVDRRKRQSAGAGNNPYEYVAMAPSELVGEVVGQVQDELNVLFNMDSRLGEEAEAEAEDDAEPVRIEVESAEDTAPGGTGPSGADEPGTAPDEAGPAGDEEPDEDVGEETEE